MAEFDPRERFAQEFVARLATVTPSGAPHLVPVVFALQNEPGDPGGPGGPGGPGDDVLYTAVDAKRKTTPRLRRLTNIAHNPRVSLLVDHYAADWAQLWWVRADGTATIHSHGAGDPGDPEVERGYRLLRAKYPQYESVPLTGPVLRVDVRHWSCWQA